MKENEAYTFALHGNRGFSKMYNLIAGILMVFISCYFFLKYSSSSLLVIILIISIFPGIYFILIGFGLFSNPYKTYIKIDDYCLAYKFKPFTGVKRIPWSHLIDVDIKSASMIFTFINYGKKEIPINNLNHEDMELIKQIIIRYWAEKKLQKE